MTNTLPLATGKKVLLEDFFVVLSEKQSRVVLLFQCLNPTLASWCPEIVEESTGRLSVRTIRPGLGGLVREPGGKRGSNRNPG